VSLLEIELHLSRTLFCWFTDLYDRGEHLAMWCYKIFLVCVNYWQVKRLMILSHPFYWLIDYI